MQEKAGDRKHAIKLDPNQSGTMKARNAWKGGATISLWGERTRARVRLAKENLQVTEAPGIEKKSGKSKQLSGM